MLVTTAVKGGTRVHVTTAVKGGTGVLITTAVKGGARGQGACQGRYWGACCYRCQGDS